MKASLAPKGDFILPEGKVFLGGATMGAVLRSNELAHQEYSRTRSLSNDVTPVYAETARETREAVGRLLDAPGSVFFSGNCTSAKSILAASLRLCADDTVVVARTPYSGPWFATAAKVHLVEAATSAYLQAIAQLGREKKRNPSRHTRVLVCAGAVNFHTGCRLDIPALYAAVKDLPGGLLMADASQWGGAISAREFADAIFITGNKWLMADHGISPTWVNLDRLPVDEALSPPRTGWKHVHEQAHPAELSALELGGKPWGALWTLHNASHYLLRLGGLQAVDRHIRALVKLATDLLHEGGVPLLSPIQPEWQSGNVCIALATLEEASALRRRLQEEENVVLSDGGGVPRLRLTPSVFTDEADILHAVQGILRLWR